MSKPRLLLVGAGSMGSLHARVIAQSDRCELAGIVELDAERGQSVAEKYGTTWYPELDTSHADAVVVAAATEAHYDMAKRVLEIGLPLFVEKPLTTRVEQARELVFESQTKALPLMCGLLERFNPAILTAETIIHEPHLFMSVRHSPYAPRIKTGVAWDLLVHDVDLALHILPGEAVSSYANVAVFSPLSLPDAEDVANIAITMSSGSLATTSASRLAQRKVRTVTLYDLERMVELDLLRRNVTVYRNVSTESFGTQGQDYRQQEIMEIPELVTNREPLASQLDHFLDILQGVADMDEERRQILPVHEVISAGLAEGAR